jgi:hypothetical protein
MACLHRFLGLHIKNSLFPDWEIDHLFIGTFNPEWDRPKALNAEYFYGRSAYFWDAISIIFEDQPFQWIENNKENMIAFCKRNKIGFTDLISIVEDADIQNETHKARIFTVLDSDLEEFGSINWNTNKIINYLNSERPSNIYFTLLSGNKQSIFSKEIVTLELAAQELGITAKRLHSPTGARLGNGSPRLHELVERWVTESSLPAVDLKKYPYVTTSKLESKEKAKGSNAVESIQIMGRYILSVDISGKYSIIDLVTGEDLKVYPTLVNIVIPYIAAAYRHTIELYSKSKGKSPKNTRTLAKEILGYLGSI